MTIYRGWNRESSSLRMQAAVVKKRRKSGAMKIVGRLRFWRQRGEELYARE